MNTATCIEIPELILFEEYKGDYFIYEDEVYRLFQKDFIESRPIFGEEALALKRYPVYKNKEATFWHIVSEGPIEKERIPDLRRYERILWPKKVIEYCYSKCRELKIWKNIRNGEKRILLWCEDIEYLVILADRGKYKIFWTAYPVMEEHRKKKLMKEYQEYIALK